MNVQGMFFCFVLFFLGKCTDYKICRVQQRGEYWQPLDSESITNYSLTLHQWTAAIIRSLEEDGFYSFYLSDAHIESAKKLKILLLASAPPSDSTTLVNAFHEFVKFILFPQEYIGRPYSKWDNSVECLFALSALQQKGIFKEAHNVTQMFAHTFYHVRGAILFEGYRIRENFGGNLYK
jgi:hypothetical protein